MADANPFGPQQLAAARIDPDLMRRVTEDLAKQLRRRRRKTDILATCAQAYFDHMGIDPDLDADPLADEHLLVIAAMVSRLNAVAALRETGLLPPSMTSDVMIEAACSAKLLFEGGDSHFQLLDFLAQAAKAGKKW